MEASRAQHGCRFVETEPAPHDLTSARPDYHADVLYLKDGRGS